MFNMLKIFALVFACGFGAFANYDYDMDYSNDTEMMNADYDLDMTENPDYFLGFIGDAIGKVVDFGKNLLGLGSNINCADLKGATKADLEASIKADPANKDLYKDYIKKCF